MRPSPSPFPPQKSCACAPPPISKRKKGWWTSSQQAFTSHHFVDHLIIPIQSFPFINFLDYTCITVTVNCYVSCFNRHFTSLCFSDFLAAVFLFTPMIVIYSTLKVNHIYMHIFFFLSNFTQIHVYVHMFLSSSSCSLPILCWKKVELYAFLENVKQHTYIAKNESFRLHPTPNFHF